MEVQEIASHHSVPIIPIIMKGKEEVATFSMLRRRSRWVAETLAYDDQDDLLNRLDEEIVKRAQAMRRDLDGEGDRVADTGVEGAPR
jgi:hypothetical protein